MIEAMACGTPVVAFAGGAVEEIVENGVNGWICRDVADMADRIAVVRGSAAACCRDFVGKAIFGRATMTERYLDVYDCGDDRVGRTAADTARGLNGRRHPGSGPVLHPRDGVEGGRAHGRPQARRYVRGVRLFRRHRARSDRGQQGLYHEGTRYLSRFRLRLNGHNPLLLSSRVKDDNELFGADLTNPDIPLDRRIMCSRTISFICSARVFCGKAPGTSASGCGTTAAGPCTSALTFDVDADFADIFEVRGTPRPRRGTQLHADASATRACASAIADSTAKSAGRCSSGASRRRSRRRRASCASSTSCAPHSPATLSVAIRCERQHRPVTPVAYEIAESGCAALDSGRAPSTPSVETSSERFNQWVRRSTADLRMLVSTRRMGRIRMPACHGSARRSGATGSSRRSRRCGSIRGLRAACSSIWPPRRPIASTKRTMPSPERFCTKRARAKWRACAKCRSASTTAASTRHRCSSSSPAPITNDRRSRVSPQRCGRNVERALDWIDRYGDRDGDGFVEYARQSPVGLVQQGWKDSHDSVFHADGSLAEPPIALCEVQAYVYDARVRAAKLADALGEATRGDQLRHQAQQLRARVRGAVLVRTGRHLRAGARRAQTARAACARRMPANVCSAASPAADRARRVAEAPDGRRHVFGLGHPDAFSRRVALQPDVVPQRLDLAARQRADRRRLLRYRFDELIGAPFDRTLRRERRDGRPSAARALLRIPSAVGEGPTSYPVACSPQAWASGVVFHLIQSCLRLSIDVARAACASTAPSLPPFLTYLRLLNLELPFGQADLLFEQQPLDVA